jgi:hypothetical protein
MSRMNAAWSNSEHWTEAIPEIFKQPMTIAFGGAVLAHAIFFLGLPVVAGKDNQPNIADTPLVELRPQDLSQIPPDATQSNQIPPNFTQSKLPTGTLLPGSSSLLTPSILSPSVTTPAPIGSTSVTPGSDYSFPTYNSPLFSSGAYSSDSGSALTNAQLTQIAKKQQDLKEVQVKKDKIAAQEAADKERRDGKPPIDGIQPGQAPTAEQLAKQSQMPPNTSKPGDATPPVKPSPIPDKPADEKIIAANPTLYAFDSKQTGPTIGLTLAQVFGNWYNKPDSKEKEIYSSSPKQPEQFQIDTPTKTLPYPVQVNKEPVAVIPDYAQKVKEGKETNGKAIVGIALDGQGKFVSGPSIIQSTGYPVLDAYAIEYVKSRMFRVTGRSGLYYMVIPIDPPLTKPVS